MDPAMRHVGGGQEKDKLGASTSEMSRFETEMLARGDNLHALAELPGQSAKHVTERTGLPEKLIKIGAKAVHHARYVTFQMAEVTVPRHLFRAILDRIRRPCPCVLTQLEYLRLHSGGRRLV